MLKRLALLLFVCCLTACGGGSGSTAGTTTLGTNGSSGTGTGTSTGTGTGTGTGTTAAASLTLTLSSATVTAAAPVTASAKVLDAQGNPVNGVVVKFTTTAGLGTFNVVTALSNASGQASVILYPAISSSSGADQVVATATVAGASVSGSQGFQLSATNVSVSAFTSDLGASTLSAYGQTNLTVTLAGSAPGTPVSLSLTSVCISAAKATITPATASTTSGTATFTYRDQGCGATNAVDQLQATVAGASASGTLNLSIASPAASAIKFVSAAPTTIYLRGPSSTGLPINSTVSFQVVDVAGNPLPNQSVTLNLNTVAGGLTLDGNSASVTKRSDSAGLVTAIVNSGTVPTPVRVKAVLGSTGASTVSSSLAVAVGLPSQINFSLSQATKNIEGFNIDGVPNSYTIFASDRSGNPVPDGTAINFVTEGGQIQAVGMTSGNPGSGSATVTFRSSAPRPDDGRVTVLAYSLGEESFLDLNGNNVYDAGEPFQDLGNVFKDRSFDGVYDASTDEYVSLGITGNVACVAPASTLLALDASIPSIPGTCDGVWGQAYVRRAIETVLSTSSSDPVWIPSAVPASPGTAIALRTSPATTTTTFYHVGGSTLTGAGAAGSISILIRDANPVRLNPVAAGSIVSVAASTGITVQVTGGTPVPSTLEASPAVISYAFVSGTTTGSITVSVQSPSGLITSTAFRISQL